MSLNVGLTNTPCTIYQVLDDVANSWNGELSLRFVAHNYEAVDLGCSEELFICPAESVSNVDRFRQFDAHIPLSIPRNLSEDALVWKQYIYRGHTIVGFLLDAPYLSFGGGRTRAWTGSGPVAVWTFIPKLRTYSDWP